MTGGLRDMRTGMEYRDNASNGVRIRDPVPPFYFSLRDFGFQKCLPFFPFPLFLSIDLPCLSSVLQGVKIGVSVLTDFTLDPCDGLFQNALLQLTFPDNDNVPSLSLQLTPHFLIPLLISGNLSCPELCVGLWDFVITTALMAMPKAAVNEDGCAVLCEDNIRSARKALDIHPIAEAPMPERITEL